MNGHMLKNIGPVRHQGEHFNPRLIRGNIWGFRGSTFHRKSGYMIDLQKQITFCIHKLNSFIDITMLQLSRAKPCNQDIWRRRRVLGVVLLAKNKYCEEFPRNII